MYYRPQKRLKGSRNSELEETTGRTATQIDMNTEDINTGAIRPDVQPREQPKPLFSHYGDPSHKTDVLRDHRLDQERSPLHNQQFKQMLSPNEANCSYDKKLRGDCKTQGQWRKTNEKHHKEEADERWENLDDNQNVDRTRRHGPNGSDQ